MNSWFFFVGILILVSLHQQVATLDLTYLANNVLKFMKVLENKSKSPGSAVCKDAIKKHEDWLKKQTNECKKSKKSATLAICEKQMAVYPLAIESLIEALETGCK
ncbi:uncharacterized protein LOC124367778 [Homalodisca vitripennis]|uniref:uncharacterized protein LOC124367778 n=1 Tax=Homalodisca vitripennis TaxID=197043 RepID=UPI001EEB5E9D|nr:uncharacterized protein LOC124367778 [Homalodisca vitripennis]